jgi:hypothetical protein
MVGADSKHASTRDLALFERDPIACATLCENRR